MPTSKEIKTMRIMAWERAKGELQSMLKTFDPHDMSDAEKYEGFQVEFIRFIKTVQSNGWHE